MSTDIISLDSYTKVAKAVSELEPEVISPVIPRSSKLAPGMKPGWHGQNNHKRSLLDDCLRKALKRTQKNGRTAAENIALVMLEKALKGDVSMIKLIAERDGGLPTVKVDEIREIHVTVERVG